MDLEELIKYIVWIIFFGIALVGVFALLRSLGIVG